MGKYYSYDDGLKYLRNYCTKQERCYKDIEDKFSKMGWWGDNYEDYRSEAMFSLIQDNYLNEQRFTESFVRGKFRMKGWGKQKLERELKLKDVSKYNISKALESEIDDNEYQQKLYSILEKKNRTLRNVSNYERRGKLIRFATYKGYEANIISIVISEIIEEI